MESGLRELLDKIYELEGLVHLTIKRENDSSDFIRLISKKGKEIGEICSSFQTSTQEGSHDQTQASDIPLLEEYTIEENTDSELKNPKEQEDSLPEKSSENRQRGKLVFSINDRFRFKKELFENSDIDFNNTLALVASMENFEEAEDYFLSEEGFDKNSVVVQEFLRIIKQYFK